MVAHERANRILAAWLAGNAERFRAEIEGVFLIPGSFSDSTVEKEECELLESIAFDLWISLVRTPHGGERYQSAFALLEHLSRRSGEGILKRSCAA
jgi:hypothetical protein